MVVGRVRGILIAQGKSTWNRAYRESGMAAAAAGGIMFGLVGFVLVPLYGLATRISLQFARPLAVGDRAADAVLWLTVFLAVIVVVFGVVGGLRHQLRLLWSEFGRYPVSRTQLLLAELPAGAVEVMPMLALPLILGYGTGLAVGQPAAAPAAVAITLQALLWLLLVQHLTGSIKRTIRQRSGRSLAAAAAVAGVALAAVWLVRRGPEGWWLLTPAGQGHLGIAEIAQGEAASGWLRQLVPLLCTALLVVVAGRVHYVELATAGRAVRGRSAERSDWRFTSPAQGIARLLLSEILGSRWGRTMILMPAFLVGLAVAVHLIVVNEPAAATGIEDAFQRALRGLPELPMFAIALVLVPLFNADIWLNQFGWDGRGARTLLSAPVSLKSVLYGKLLGAAAFAGIQVVFVIMPLLWLRAPSWTEAVAGAGAAGVALVWTMGIGHVLSARFPRPVRPDAAGPPPKSVIHNVLSAVVTLTLATVLIVPWLILSAFGNGIVALGMVAMLALSAVAYRLALPTWAAAVRLHQERVITQVAR